MKKSISLLTFAFLFLSFVFAQQGIIQLPATGQTISYYPGDDGDLQVGVPIPANCFIDNGDGSVIDLFTGLMWMKDANLIATKDPNFDQDRTPGDGDIDWKTALDYVQLLNDENYLGYNDWRLPNLAELRSLVNLGVPDTVFPSGYPFTNLQDLYWSSTTSENLRSLAIGVFLREHYAHSNIINPAGETEEFAKDPDITGANYWKYYCLPVRSTGNQGQVELPATGQLYTFYPDDDGFLKKGTAWPTPRLVDNDDGSVSDRLTGLMWAQDANLMLTRNPEFDTNQWVDGAINWQHALDYVTLLNSENYLGHNDWRMPNRNEMTSLVDFSRKQPAIPERFPFSNMTGYNFEYSYWTSTTRADETDQAWVVWLSDGMMGGGNKLVYEKTKDWHVWPVRTDSTPLSTSSINGTISLDGNPYPRAEIELSGPISGFIRSNLNGEFEFDYLPDGTYTVTPKHKYATFYPFSCSVTLESSSESCNFTSTYKRAYGWVDISENLFPYGGAAGGCLSDIWFIGNEGWITNSCSYAEIYHTTDGGETWDVQEPLVPCHAIYMLSEEVGYAGGESGILCKTTNGGQNWDFFAVAPSQILSIGVSPDGSMGWCGGSEGYVSRITSTGLESQFITYTDWQSISFGSNDYGWAVSCFGRKMIYENNAWTFYGGAQYFPCYSDIQFTGPNLAWTSFGGKMMRLHDMILETFYEDTTQSIQGVFTLNLDTVWAVTTGGDILVTSQGNANIAHFSAENVADAWLSEVFASDAHHAWAIGNNGSIYRYGILEGFPAGQANILDFVVDQQVAPATVNFTAQTIHVNVPAGTDLTQIIPEIYISAGASVDPPGGTPQDFTTPVTYTVTSENGQVVKDWTATISLSDKIKENPTTKFMVFPNPGNGIFEIAGSAYTNRSCGLEIYNIFGKNIITLWADFDHAGKTKLNISFLPSGIYFIRLIAENKSTTQKIIISK
ncbi:MAG: DUF1566 domain-containing protein [Bacteroidales bacterium]|nr:DUF1566 domain-containing protein [Bacteroidales bacterium]MCF8405100.1 DUF1566 domain-containing protein [Bacteroidales bacterium]